MFLTFRRDFFVLIYLRNNAQVETEEKINKTSHARVQDANFLKVCLSGLERP